MRLPRTHDEYDDDAWIFPGAGPWVMQSATWGVFGRFRENNARA